MAKPRDPAIMEAKMSELNKDSFINTFQKKAMEWYSRYKPKHFATHYDVVVAFLQRFWSEKSISQLCDKIRSLKQEDMDVEAKQLA